MAFTVSAADNILKTRYLGPIREQLENSSVLFAEIDKETKLKPSGKNWTVPLHTGRNITAGFGRAVGGTLPTPGQQSYDVAVIPKSRQYGRIEISGDAFTSTRDDAGAFVRALSSEVDACVRDMKKSFNRQLHSDGVDALGFWTTADNSTTFDLDDNRGNGFVFLKVGMVFDVIDASDNATKLGDSMVVTTVAAPTATTVTVGASGTVAGTADTDYAVLEDTLGEQLMGIAGIISNANPTLLSGGLHGLTVASKPYWTAQVNSNSGTNRTLTPLLMRRVMSSVASNSDFKIDDIKFILTSFEVQDEYYNTMVAEKRYPNTLSLDSGYSGLDFSGIPVIADPDCRKNRMYFIVPDSMKVFEEAPLDWMDRDGGVLHRVENQDMYRGTAFTYFNLGCLNRNANGLLDDIAISAA
jgi:hypothetical protein